MNNYQQNSQGITEETQFGTIHHNLSDLMPASSEIGHLWIAYEAESMSICFLKKFVDEAKDPEIHQFLQQVLDSSSQRVQAMENIFRSIHCPIPVGFGDKDIIINTRALFSETFTALYTRMMQKMISHHYVSAATSCYRSDFRDFFSECLKISDQHHRRGTEILLAKGILQKHPSIITPRFIDNISDKDYFGSYFTFFGYERILNAIEIGNIYTMMEIKQLIRTYELGCSQVVRSNKIRNYLLKSIEISDKQLRVLEQLLTDQDIPSPSLSEILISDSQDASFSDRLILSHSVASTAYIATAHGLAIPNISRKDISGTMIRFISEILGLAKDGGELMVDEGWLERIPETANRKELTQQH